MRFHSILPLSAALGLALSAQTPAPQPASGPQIKFRGALLASGAASDRQTQDGSLFLRSGDAGDGQLSLDALQLGADVTLTDGWGMKFTLVAGQLAKDINGATFSQGTTPDENGSIAWPEAMLTWTGASDTLKFGRMYSPLGMEVADGTQDITASRGILFTYALPFAQVGINWHHAFTSSWSADLWVFNGEDRIKDNNQGKTAGLGVTYNHEGSADDYVTVMAFSGAEQDGLGAQANTGAEGRKRNRVSLAGQWIWGKATLQWEGEYAQETFPPAALAGAAGNAKAAWYGGGGIFKYQFTSAWAGFARAEALRDDTGVRLGLDPTVAAAHPPMVGSGLLARSAALGVERRWHATFSRLEVRRDSLNQDVREGTAGNGKPFRSADSVTLSVGTSF